MSDSAVRLTCEQCKRRKTRCDKGAPCSACRAAELTCRPVQRARLPRGRTGEAKNRNAVLEDKVARLEILVSQLEAQVQGDEGDLSADDAPQVQRLQIANRTGDFVAQDFWVALSDEVSGLREALEDSDGNDELPAHHGNLHSSSYMLLFGNGAISLDYDALPWPTGSMRQILLRLFHERVDCIFKVLHWPTALATIDHYPTGGQDSVEAHAVRALEFTIYFLAMCSTNQHEWARFRLGDREALVEQYRLAAEISLAGACLLTTTNIIVLQAFVLYLAGVRSHMGAASTWTLLALAIRIADACGAGSEMSAGLSTFEVELRRRVWFSLALLDSQTSFSRGSLPLLDHKSLISPPLNISDSEMLPSAVQDVSNERFTDMSFSCLYHQAHICQRKLADPAIAIWSERLEVVAVFEQFVSQNFSQSGYSSNPLERYTAIASKDMVTSMQVVLRRPPYKRHLNLVPASDEFNILDQACRVLQSRLFKRVSDEFAMYSWFSWPKWYALAVVLVELCGPLDRDAFGRAYAVAEQSFTDYAQLASDVSSGLLWKPIVRLMRQVQKIKATHSPGSIGGREVDSGADARDLPQSAAIQQPTSVDGGSPSGVLPGTAQTTFSEGLDLENDVPWFQWDTFLNQTDDVFGPM